ncbi:MAG: DEAD/DEAH box helicase [Lachnospiraceae bacterium]|nr:DEAD/DEAH box helicase [Lachnospiraceae bacterium]
MNFKILQHYIKTFPGLDTDLIGMLGEKERQTEQIQKAMLDAKRRAATSSFAEIPVEELSESKAGIRVAALKKAGFDNLGQLQGRSLRALESINGIGETQAKAIRQTLDVMEQRMAMTMSLRISPDNPTPETNVLLLELFRYLKKAKLWEEGMSLCGTYHARIQDALEKSVIRNKVRWLFSSGKEKEKTLEGFSEFARIACEGYEETATDLLRRYTESTALSFEQARQHFAKESASYYALLEHMGNTKPDQTILYRDMPVEMADAVDATTLDTSLLKVTLRSYQEFGTKYILHQGQVLLGDEMGLGKTVMAIAAMASLEAENPGSKYMVVCPASVLINWYREIEKHSCLKPYLLHGSSRREEMQRFLHQGGVAVTNYESLDEFVEELEEIPVLSMLVVDEAHYIKNPEAKRTKYLYEVKQFAEKTLLMTGTPLENRVEEMCALIAVIRQDLIEEIHQYAFLKKTDAFKKLLAPVYLRRTREDVLKELPELIEEDEWLEATPADKEPYRTEVIGGNFMGMRRIGWLQEDMTSSSKASRLLQLCENAFEEGRKVLIFSYYRDTLEKVKILLGARCLGPLTGSTSLPQRQELIDQFSEEEMPVALASQVLAGGTGLNIQAASVVIFCEPQIKPSLETQAVSRVYRMGQVHSVLVYHLLCSDTVDEDMHLLLQEKQEIFDDFAQESEMADIEKELGNSEWIRSLIERERSKI